jgi:hypothetical protein
MKGYYNNPLATKDSFHNGWLCTGDIAIQKGGKFFMVDRKKELLKYEGLQIAPAELEVMHPAIQEAAVIGVCSPNDPSSELPRAYVVRAVDLRVSSSESARQASNSNKSTEDAARQSPAGITDTALNRTAGGTAHPDRGQLDVKKGITLRDKYSTYCTHEEAFSSRGPGHAGAGHRKILFGTRTCLFLIEAPIQRIHFGSSYGDPKYRLREIWIQGYKGNLGSSARAGSLPDTCLKLMPSREASIADRKGQITPPVC